MTPENASSEHNHRARYERAMVAGAAAYRDVLDRLEAEGLPTFFTQTGGMNAALQVQLERGAVLLVTDAEDALPWARGEHEGWAVGLYETEEDQDAVRFESTDDSSVEALLSLVRRVLLPPG